MKKLLFAFCLMFGAAAVYAQDTTSTQQQYPSQDMNQGSASSRETIDVSQLPAPVAEALQGQDYSGWTVSTAHKKTKANGEVEYTVKLKSGNDTKKIVFDEQGNKIKEKGKDKDTQ